MTLRSSKSLCAIALLAILAYLPTLNFDFAYDDLLVITGNPQIIGGAPGLNHLAMLFASATPPGDLYRPLPALTYWIDFLIAGNDAGWFHGVNILLYAILCVLVYTLYSRLLRTPAAALWSAVIFTVHPIHVEAVANIVGRAELLAGILGLIGLLTLLRSWRNKPATPLSMDVLVSALALFLALLSKESAFTFIPLYVSAALFFRGKFLSLIPHLALGMLALSMRYNALGSAFLITPESNAINPENPLLNLPFSARLIPALKIQGDYLLSLIAPIDLSADYSLLPEALLQKTYALSGALSLTLLAACAIITLRSSERKSIFCGLWFLITFALTSNIFLPIGTIRADRLALVPGIGMIGLLLNQLFTLWPGRARLVAALMACTFVFQTIRLIPVWQNNGTLFQHLVQSAPENPKALYNYGIYLYTTQHDLSGSEHYLRRTLELVPDHLYSMKTLADLALARKDYARVAYWYTRILRNYPEEQQVREQLEALKR